MTLTWPDPSVLKHLWFLFVVGGVIGGFATQKKLKLKFAERPELEALGNRLNWGFAFWGNVPWVVMGVGILLERVPGTYEFLFDGHEYRFVKGWFVMMVALFAGGSVWMIRGGARDFAEVLGAYQRRLTPKVVGSIWALIVLWNLFLGSLLFKGNLDPLDAELHEAATEVK